MNDTNSNYRIIKMADNQDEGKSVNNKNDITENLEKQNSDESPIFSILPQYFHSISHNENDNSSFSFDDWSQSTINSSNNGSNTSSHLHNDFNQMKLRNDLQLIEKSMVTFVNSRQMTKTDEAETKSTSRIVANAGIEQVINGTTNSNMEVDKQRQWIILALLEQVTSLHDVHASPRTFAMHVLHLLEKKVLEPSTVRDLFEYHGLVPSNWSSNTELYNNSVSEQEGNHEKNVNSQAALTSNQERELTLLRQYFLGQSSSSADTIESLTSNQLLIQNLSLATQNKTNRDLFQSYLRHLTHPILTSRSRRDYFYPNSFFPLSSGSFGSVYHVQSKLDSEDYALKQIYFQNQLHFVTNNDKNTEAIDLTLREVKCLAKLNHPHCVRYYTSWLEPCWNTRHEHKNHWSHNLLESKPIDGDGSYYSNPMQRYHQNNSLAEGDYELDSKSKGEHVDESDSDYSEWSQDLKSSSTTASYIFSNQESSPANQEKRQFKQHPYQNDHERTVPINYQQKNTIFHYEICLYIQMELCSSKTLADWIHDRNHNTYQRDVKNDNDQIIAFDEKSDYDDTEDNCSVNKKFRKNIQRAHSEIGQKTRVYEALIIMKQITNGLEHIHSKQIIHRDLKPANIFCSKDDSNFFKIGDFGLSKPLYTSNVENGNQSTSSSHGKKSQYYTETEYLQDSMKLEQTIGVGTVSYASPEQISSSSYNTQADIFSLGLIFLELLGNYKTAHERSNAFHAIRKERKVLLFLAQPDVKNGDCNCEFILLERLEKLILDMTDVNPKNRPIASSVLKLIEEELTTIEKREDERLNIVEGSVETDDKFKELIDKLREKDMIIQRQQTKIDDMEQMILSLQKQLRGKADDGL